MYIYMHVPASTCTYIYMYSPMHMGLYINDHVTQLGNISNECHSYEESQHTRLHDKSPETCVTHVHVHVYSAIYPGSKAGTCTCNTP